MAVEMMPETQHLSEEHGKGLRRIHWGSAQPCPCVEALE